MTAGTPHTLHLLSSGTTPKAGDTFRAMDVVIIDDEIAPALAAAPIGFELSVDALPAMRAARGEMFAGVPLSDGVERTDHVVSEDPRVVVRVHRPKGIDGPLPCVYSIHGGGYVLGSYDMDDAKFDRQCVHFPCVGVSVEYRLAPEAAYPGPLDDCYAGLHWIHEHAAELGIAPDRIGISGVSAGGGLAAALALLARDRGEVPVAFQLLECPMIDDRQTTSSSRLEGLPIWSRESNEFGWRSLPGGALRRRRTGVRGRLARHGPRGTSARAGDRRRRRRLPRRGHRLRAPTQPGGRAHRAARPPGRAARRADVHRLGGRAAVEPDGDAVAGAAAAMSAVTH